MLEISQLQTILAVSKTGSFSRAAENLHVTQSAISQSVKNIELKLGVQVFKRTGKKVLLTPEGEKLYLLAKDFMKRMEDTLDDITHEKEQIAGKVRIGTLIGVGKSWLSPELMTMSENYSELSIIVKLGFYEDIVKEFEEGRLDIVILPENALPEHGEKVFFSEEKAALIFPKSDKFKIDKNISLEELTKYPTILFEQDDHLYSKWCLEHFGKKPEKINIRYAVNAHGSILQAVSKGLGVAVIPLHVLERSFFKDKVEVLEGVSEVQNFNFFLVYHKDEHTPERIKMVVNHLNSFDNPLS